MGPELCLGGPGVSRAQESKMESSSKRNPPWGANGPSVVASAVWGLFAFGLGLMVVSQLGLAVVESTVIASLVGGLVAVFIYRERSLLKRISVLENEQLKEFGLISQRLENFYENEVGAIVLFDASALIVERASPGFYRLLGYEESNSGPSARLWELLKIPSARLETMVDRVHNESGTALEVLDCKNNSDEPIRLRMVARLIRELNSIEASFEPVALGNEDRIRMEETIADLERFRRGMVRREERILELKGEVNQLAREHGEAPRYRVDDRSEDSQFGRKLATGIDE